MTETLFGGLLLAALLFFVSRRLGLANFWAGILSGIVPFVAYLFYSRQHWAGGDVLAIHFAIYLANAGLLIVFGGMQQKKQSMHWAPRLIVAFFIGLVLLNAVLLSISSRGLPDALTSILLPNPEHQKVHTAFPGVVPHDQNKSYQPHLQRIEQQRNLGWQLGLQGFDKLQSNRSQQVTVSLLDRDGKPVPSARVELGLWRMANSRDDKKLLLNETATGIYQADINLPDAGRWLLEFDIQRAGDRYIKQQQLFLEQ